MLQNTRTIRSRLFAKESKLADVLHELELYSELADKRKEENEKSRQLVNDQSKRIEKLELELEMCSKKLSRAHLDAKELKAVNADCSEKVERLERDLQRKEDQSEKLKGMRSRIKTLKATLNQTKASMKRQKVEHAKEAKLHQDLVGELQEKLSAADRRAQHAEKKARAALVAKEHVEKRIHEEQALLEQELEVTAGILKKHTVAKRGKEKRRRTRGGLNPRHQDFLLK